MRKAFLIALVFFGAAKLWAQPTKPGSLGQFELSVTEAYKAQVAQAQKILTQPSAEDTVQEKLPVSYGISSMPLPVSFTPEMLPPARIAKVEVPALYQGLVKAGFGLYNTPFLEAYYNGKRSSKRSFGVSARHFSTQNGVQDIRFEDNGLSRNHLGGYYKHFARNYTLGTQAQVNLDKYSYYGRPNLGLTPDGDTSLGEAPFNWYRQFAIETSLTEARTKSLGWLTQSKVGYSYLNDNYGSQENDARISSQWQLPANDKNLNVDLNLWYFNTRYDSLYRGADQSNLYNQGTFQLQFRPHMTTVYNDVIFDFGLNLYSVAITDSRTNQAQNDMYFFPELVVSYPLVKNVLQLSGGVKGSIHRNTYQQLVAQNPYLTPGQSHNPERTTDLFANLRGKLSNTTTFNVQGGYKQMAGKALFYRTPFFYLDSASYGLEVRYAVVNSTYATGEVSTLVNDNLTLGAQVMVQSLTVKNDERPWHLPSFTGSVNAGYTLKEKIKMSTQLNFVGPRQAFDQLDNQALESTLPGFVDANLEVEYLYNTKISAFIKAANLLNSQYDFYLGYRAQSINFLMGFAYRF
jgi:hypothetical protein